MADFDLHLFRLINGTWSHPSLDPVFRLVSNWERIQLFVLAAAGVAFFFLSHRWKYRYALMLLAVALADILASDVKILACRQRPYLAHPEIVRQPENYGFHSNSYSMPSNHAANMFAAAVVAVAILRRKRWAALFFLPALAVGYSRVYLGVHYPTDVLAGFGVGGLAAGIILLTDRLLPALKFDDSGRATSFHWSGLTALLLVCITIFRFSALGHAESANGFLEAALFPDEAQLWVQSESSTQSSGATSPAMPALVRLSRWIVEGLFGTAPITRVFVLRAMAVKFALYVQLLGCLLAWRAFKSARAVFFTAAILIFMPVFALNTHLCLPRNAMLVFWAGCAVLLHDGFIHERKWAFRFAYIGVFLGIFFDPHIAWLSAGVLLYLLFSPSGRLWLTRKEPYLFITASFLGLLVSSIWTIYIDVLRTPFVPANLGKFILFQALGVSPLFWLWIMGCTAAAMTWRRHHAQPPELLLVALGAPMFLSSWVESGFHPAESNSASWLLHGAAPTYFTLAIVASGSLSALFDNATGLRRTGLAAATVLSALLPFGAYYYICETPAFARLSKSIKWIRPEWDPAYPATGYQGLAEIVEKRLQALPSRAQTLVLATDRDTEAELRFFANGRLVLDHDAKDNYGWNALVSVPGHHESFPLKENVFRKVGPGEHIAVQNRGVTYRGFTLFYCEGYYSSPAR